MESVGECGNAPPGLILLIDDDDDEPIFRLSFF